MDALFAMIEYIYNNPVRRGLVEDATDWIWSSARFYAGATDVPIRRIRCQNGYTRLRSRIPASESSPRGLHHAFGVGTE